MQQQGRYHEGVEEVLERVDAHEIAIEVRRLLSVADEPQVLVERDELLVGGGFHLAQTYQSPRPAGAMDPMTSFSRRLYGKDLKEGTFRRQVQKDTQ